MTAVVQYTFRSGITASARQCEFNGVVFHIATSAKIGPGVTVLGDVEPYVVIGHSCHITENVSIGFGTVIRDMVVINHNSRIEPLCYIGNGAGIGNNVTIKMGSWLADGARVRSNSVIQF